MTVEPTIRLETDHGPEDRRRAGGRSKWVRLRRQGRAGYLRFRRRLPRLIRSDEIWLVVLAGIVGIGAGLIVAAMIGVSRILHLLLFATYSGDVSGAAYIDPVRIVCVPIVGGMLMGLAGLILSRRRRTAIVDPVEANALHGGRLSIKDSLVLIGQTLISNGFGASVGLEAGYTQGGAALASGLARILQIRRADMRTLVGCGAAGAIAAAFNAPLTGAFYAFELIIASYTIGALAPVVVASIAAVTVTHLLTTPLSFDIGFAGAFSASDYVLVVVIGIAAAVLGILIMGGVAFVESLFRASRIPHWLRPAIGGAMVGGMGLITPTVLSSGHSALHVGLDATFPPLILLMMICLKSLASAVSIGSGFRGGLFFASLFLGAMLGKLVAWVWVVAFGLQTPPLIIAVIGMSALATAVLGGPLTMSFLALETTGSLPLTIAVLTASVVSSITVRRLFGYSFTTWRFHLRGEAIRSAADIGWIRELSVGRMMRRDVRTVPSDLALSEFRRKFPLGSSQRVVLIDEAGRYAGIVLVAHAHGPEIDVETVAELALNPKDVLLPQMNIRQAASLFEASKSEELAVVDDRATLKVLGLLTEQYALRRYNAELNSRSRDTATV
ncbi:chloride channel protein, CIC family [Bosea sp. CRIB-10]|jgi:chloride channel protein, CIC family|uniref:chloride channel protein n=1 Tax=Bosea sp. CRIB-10 TaxID=378404 RepID=UPI0008E6B52C|nr:chloride channel protein [Bosea sp. CRIB-10]SFD31199.1 chloride channel protein, CIC family [Bosea sp. CRIB-10]